jgi:hypothetical protein
MMHCHYFREVTVAVPIDGMHVLSTYHDSEYGSHGIIEAREIDMSCSTNASSRANIDQRC